MTRVQAAATPQVEPQSARVETCAPLPAPTPPPREAWSPTAPEVRATPIEEPGRVGSVMAPFYEAVARMRRGLRREPIRIAVYGDSNLTMDFQTGRMRRVLQGAHGDAGHGFVALGQPWSHYQHRDVRHGESGYEVYAISTTPIGDGGYGLSGIVVENQWQGATAFVATADPEAPVGGRASRFDVFYLKQRGFGTFDVVIDGERVRRVDTSGERERSLGLVRVDVEDGPHRLELVSSSPARVRLLGAVLERRQPGFVIDSFGVGALNTRAMTMNDVDLGRSMLEARGYDLVIFMTGANDVFTMPGVPDGMRDLVARQRDALPGVPILIVTPSDRGVTESFEPTIRVVEQRRQIARENGTALWDLWEAMGGRDSMARFVRSRHAMFDGIHFNQRGGNLVGDLLVDALWQGLSAYQAENPEAGCADGAGHVYDALVDPDARTGG